MWLGKKATTNKRNLFTIYFAFDFLYKLSQMIALFDSERYLCGARRTKQHTFNCNNSLHMAICHHNCLHCFSRLLFVHLNFAQPAPQSFGVLFACNYDLYFSILSAAVTLTACQKPISLAHFHSSERVLCTYLRFVWSSRYELYAANDMFQEAFVPQITN